MQPIYRRASRLACISTMTLGALGAAAAPLYADGTRPVAKSARTISLAEHGALHLVTKHGFTLNEQGSASGSIKGTISVQLKIVSTSRVTLEVTIFPSGGSITGYGTASYHKGEATASFAGSMAIKRGSGTYSRAQGSGLSFSGTIARSNDAITVQVNGRLSD
ncbi:MAG TPA: autotransporter [Solirubrobacteraceae bacterium]|jgi:hypothetical protein|nr:autotransporter [Solirubrobacteraceae bacterium]